MQEAAKSKMTIATPTTDPQALWKTCMDLKQAVEEMQGFYNEIDFRPRMTVSRDQPTIERDGEFWLSEGETNTLSIAYQGKWRKLGVVTA